MWNTVIEVLGATWDVVAEMSPYLLFGFLAAGILSVTVPSSWIRKRLSGRGFKPTAWATFAGVPLPLCSCGVIPVAASIRQQGAGKGPTAAFLLATPQTGVDSIAATWALLGPIYAFFRVIVAFITGWAGGILVSLFSDRPTAELITESPKREAPKTETLKSLSVGLNVLNASPANLEVAKPAAAHDHSHSHDHAHEESHTCSDSSCGCHSHKQDASKPAQPKWLESLRYAAITLPSDIAWTLILGLVAAGLVTALLDPNVLSPWLGGGIIAMLVMVAVSLPIYVCSTGSIPLALGLIYAGASPGAALVFLIAGPASNLATLGVVWRLLGKSATVIYILVAIVVSISAGLLLDAGIALTGHSLAVSSQHHHGHTMTWLHHFMGIVLCLLLMYALGRRAWHRLEPRLGPQLTKLFGKGSEQPSDVPAESPTDDLASGAVIKISGMTCSHCSSAAREALLNMPSIHHAEVDHRTGVARVSPGPIDLQQAREKLSLLGFKLQA